MEQLDGRLCHDFGWQTLPLAEVTPEPVSTPAGDSANVLWNGEVRIPDATEALGPYRLVVAEYEECIADDATPYDQGPTSKARRLVFVEHRGLDL